MDLRDRRRLLRLAVHGGALALLGGGALLSGPEEARGVFSLLLLLYAATARVNPIPRVLEGHLIRMHMCPACGLHIRLHDSWACTCGFVSWQGRHALTTCPNCRREFSWVVCPRCENGILI